MAVRLDRPWLLTMGKLQSFSICCQRCSRSLRHAVTSDRAFLQRAEGKTLDLRENPEDPLQLRVPHLASRILWSTSSSEEL